MHRTINYILDVFFGDIEIHNTDEYHSSVFYEKSLKFKEMTNSRPYFEYVARTIVVKLSWSTWNGQGAWILTGSVDGGSNWSPRFLSFSDVDHPKYALNWKYLPNKSDTSDDEMIPATNILIYISKYRLK